ncbi:MAG: helix-turn-helix domain-containing protein [Shewanella sp.]
MQDRIHTVLGLIFIKFSIEQIEAIKLNKGDWALRRKPNYDDAHWVTHVATISNDSAFILANSMLRSPVFNTIVVDDLNNMLITHYGNQTKTASVLGVSRNTLRDLIRLKLDTPAAIRIKDSIYMYKGVAGDAPLK